MDDPPQSPFGIPATAIPQIPCEVHLNQKVKAHFTARQRLTTPPHGLTTSTFSRKFIVQYPSRGNGDR
ncbi:hypothetical protein ACO22_01925 [Paracoccidioides brasiliensis]|uniref:Uncharacterized protein n=1 Tax=Paracoccidioides brasiliensis TaxID=121759 RepID=A0A1D2JK62_PARBR|nr:hypothetical protein ACO22_01925 [Paracoccidioides brasiliensis]